MSLSADLGFLRSQAMYNWKPFNGFRLKRFYKEFVGPGDLCFDVGAHNGNRTATWLAIGAKVISIEPQDRFFQYLQKRFGAHPNFTGLKIGLSDEHKEMEMLISSRYPTVSTFSADWSEVIKSVSPQVKWDQKETIQIRTLDSLIEKFGMPTFCKIDVEGLEEQVLKGLSQPVPMLSFEFLPETKDRSLNCIDILMQLGDYEFNWSQAEELRFRLKNWDSQRGIKEIIRIDSRRKSGDIYARLKS